MQYFGEALKEGEQSEPSFNKVPNLISLSLAYHVILIKVSPPPTAKPWVSEAHWVLTEHLEAWIASTYNQPVICYGGGPPIVPRLQATFNPHWSSCIKPSWFMHQEAAIIIPSNSQY